LSCDPRIIRGLASISCHPGDLSLTRQKLQV
jgi:hypothetical protein